MPGERSKRATAAVAAGVVLGMLGLTAAAVPLYRLFCQVTGYGGTPQVADAAAEDVLDRTILVRFNADVDPDLPWSFQPVERAVEVRIGEERLAFYRAENRSDQPIVGTATFNVTPHTAGPFFAKIACFCFTEQVLQPGEAVDMPVSFYVDPAILEDESTADLDAITLSYTFYRDDEATQEQERIAAAEGPSS
ncbi:MAG: cytochrome c oxidase assembly protein [Geminicoccaceae bacterium]|nr:cytochrome c oxidase assembly protein [Geminicoccaceae bacterium]